MFPLTFSQIPSVLIRPIDKRKEDAGDSRLSIAKSR